MLVSPSSPRRHEGPEEAITGMNDVRVTSGAAIADMNGPLAYWGPAPLTPAAITLVAAPVVVTGPEIDALAKLTRTLHGRTWSGTHALMSALFSAADQDGRPSPAPVEHL